MAPIPGIRVGRIGWSGDPEHTWYYPGRDHVLFTTEDEIHRGSMLACLPDLPRELRDKLGYESLVTPPVRSCRRSWQVRERRR